MKQDVVVLMFGHKAQRGKDTACEYLVNKYNFKRCAFADKLKNTVADLYGFSEEQMYNKLKDINDVRYSITPRQVLQDFGNEQRQRYPNIWAEYIFREINERIKNMKGAANIINFCISDFRFKNEYDVAYNWSLDCSMYNKKLYTIKVDRPNIIGVSNPNNVSEIDLDDFKYWNFMINNNGTIEQLHDKLDYIIKCI